MVLNMLKLKTLTIVLIISLFLPSITYADDAIMVDLTKGQKAPFNGTFLNLTAMAEIAAASELQKSECELREKFAIEREKTKCDFVVANVNASLSALEIRYKSILDIKNEEIDRLTSIVIEQPNNHSHWWFAGGAVVGMLTSIAIFYASVQVSQ
jgi:hypothetical protein